ncbi:C-type lectin domain family 10 member A-like [Simochromis diagramma]|uniref:C-type lectin domain family 10 member A-like n=1 Tax=Simochromis diagramma TaxID=43689 RepID=UPI001A7EC739|nr:C-type lectin domain family 10 member A-like [Simochromis diagramma]
MVEAFSSPKMSTDTQVATHVRYSKGVRVDGEEKSQVEIQEQEDCSISPGLQENGQHTQMNRSSAKRRHFRVIAAALGALFVLMLTVIVSRVNVQSPTDNPSTTSIPFSQDVKNRATQSTNEKAIVKTMTTQSTTKKVNVNTPEKMMTTQSASQKESVNKMSTQSTTEKATVNKMTAQSTTKKVLKENANKMTIPSTTKKVYVKSTKKMMTTRSATQKGYSCPVGWLRAGSKCYYELHDRSSQENESYCQRRGGSLIVVNSREKQRILHGETTEEVQQCGLQ